ncbi:MAG: UvrD-helicase domain-containing protein, partial [Deltaproteobacteria bacterium]|nr:UvrD-helicase domain-containing protein [Deltaproteobacteria bacterium]
MSGEVIALRERKPLADAEARRAIRDDVHATLVVEAAAGTGKTTELVARIITLLVTGTATLQQLLAVTFTEKAAGEMKLRVRTEIEKARTAATDPAQRARLEAALEDLEAAAIGTIHGICADLLRERPVEARIDPAFQVAADEAAQALFEGAFEEWFQGVLADPPEGVRRLLRRSPRSGQRTNKEQLAWAARELVEHRDFTAAWERRPFHRAQELEAILSELRELVEPSPRALNPNDKLAQSIATLWRHLDEHERLERIAPRDPDVVEAELCALISMDAWHWRDQGRGKLFAQGLPREVMLERRAHMRTSLEAFAQRTEADLAALLREELRPVVAAYERRKAAAGCLDFLDLLGTARTLVRDVAGVRRELQQRFTHLLVDEFQDTDPLQAELLLLLAADDARQTDWLRVRCIPGKLFVVGDPKQAIYRFRRADIALYEQLKEQLLAGGARLLTLSTSFRSVPTVQRAINAAFEPLMLATAERSQASYVPLTASREDDVNQPAVVALPVPEPAFFNGELTKKSVKASLPAAVGAFVHWLVTRSKWTVSERDSGKRVPIEAR